MPAPFLRISNPVITFPILFLGCNLALNYFPDPPAVQEAKARNRAATKQQREEAYQRSVEERIEAFEEAFDRANPGVFDQRTDDDDAYGGRGIVKGREGRGCLGRALRALGVRSQGAGGGATTTTTTTVTALPALNLVAEIYLELGATSTARDYFLRAVSLDPTGQIPETQGGGAEKFLWLAQLSDEGGNDSVGWFERGAAVLRREMGALGERAGAEKRKKLAGALCGIVEVYMTDLSWDPRAEAKCEASMAEALLVAPRCAEPLQTLASVRISQARGADARKALSDSVAMWRDLEPEDDAVPEFATRVSLARLLMEVEMEEQAVGVVERLVQEDDGSVEAWYLGGWCLYLLGLKQRRKGEERNGAGGVDAMEDGDGDDGDGDGDEEDLYTQSMVSSREWLRQSLKLYEMVEYEDERLRDHATELVRELDGVIGAEGDSEVDGGEDEWNGFEGESEEEHEDEEMDGG